MLFALSHYKDSYLLSSSLQFYKFRVSKTKSASVVVGVFIEYGNTEEVKVADTRPLPTSAGAAGLGGAKSQGQCRFKSSCARCLQFPLTNACSSLTVNETGHKQLLTGLLYRDCHLIDTLT